MLVDVLCMHRSVCASTFPCGWVIVRILAINQYTWAIQYLNWRVMMIEYFIKFNWNWKMMIRRMECVWIRIRADSSYIFQNIDFLAFFLSSFGSHLFCLIKSRQIVFVAMIYELIMHRSVEQIISRSHRNIWKLNRMYCTNKPMAFYLHVKNSVSINRMELELNSKNSNRLRWDVLTNFLIKSNIR